MAVSLKSIGNEARERYRQQVMREVVKAAAALGLGVFAAALLALQASLIRVLTYDDFVFAQNLRATAFLALMFAAALWAGWFRRPSPRLRLIFHLSAITAISRRIVSTEGKRYDEGSASDSEKPVARRMSPHRPRRVIDLIYSSHGTASYLT